MFRAVRWWWGLALAFALLGASRLILPLPFLNEVLIFSIYAMGTNFLIGRVGYVSFGQPAYLAVGAYSTAFYLFYFGIHYSNSRFFFLCHCRVLVCLSVSGFVSFSSFCR